jgi:hypothetical protein
MVRVSIRVQEGASRFDVSVQAQSIRQALGMAAARYPGADVQVSFPIDAEVFFIEEPGTRAELLVREQPELGCDALLVKIREFLSTRCARQRLQ